MASGPNVSISGGVQALSNAIAVAIVRQQAAQTQVSTVVTGGTASVGTPISPATLQSTPALAAGTSSNDPGPSQRLVSCNTMEKVCQVLLLYVFMN